MNAPSAPPSATLLEVLAEVSSLIEDCSNIAGQLERALGSWLKNGADPADFPFMELQGIDLLRQIQNDLSALLSSEELAQEVSRNGDQVNLASVIGTPKLARVRDRLLRLANQGTKSEQPPGAAGSGALDLF